MINTDIEKANQKSILHPLKRLLVLLVKIFGLVLSFCGVVGFSAIFLFYYIATHVSDEYSNKLYNVFELIKKSQNALLVCIYILIGFLAVILIQYSYWKNREKFLKKRIKELRKQSPEN